MTDPINTLPLQQFISTVKSADASNAREIKLDTQTAKSFSTSKWRPRRSSN